MAIGNSVPQSKVGLLLRQMQVLPFKEDDREQLEKWRLSFTDATIELPHDYASPQNETAVVRDGEGKIILALNGTIGSGLTLIKNPDANRLEIVQALFLAEAALTYKAVQAGAIDSYVIVPNRMAEYIKVLEKLGYHLIADECVVMGRILVPDSVPTPQSVPEVSAPEESPTDEDHN